MKPAPRRYSVNPKRPGMGIMKVTPSLGSQRDKNNKSSENSVDEGTGFTQTGKHKLKGVKSEKRRSITLNMDPPPASIKAKRNYMSLMSDELEDRDIYGARKKLALKLQNNVMNIAIVISIITYSIATFIFTSVPEDDWKGTIDPIYHSFESIFILVFVVEVALHKYAFKEMYFSNKFNLVNFILILIIILFWVLDIIITNYTVSILLRTRGVMRLFHVPVILESIKSHIKLQKGQNMIDLMILEEEKPTAEKVVEILLQVNERLDDPKFYNDLNF